MRERTIRGWLIAALLAALPAVAATPEEVWLTAADGVEVRGDLYLPSGDGVKGAPVVLLFHQAGSNRGEYATIAPRLTELGFVALAIDQRSGGERWGFENETVVRLGDSTSYLATLPDLEAALAWKTDAGYGGETLVWGSSYSAALVFLLAAEHPEIDAILSFSPGEYLGSRSDEVRKAAKRVTRPVLVMTPSDERDRARILVDAIPGDAATFIVPKQAVHGSSMLVADRNPGAAAIWPEVEAFLAPFAD
jgi:dienelactone hydrolase